MKDDTSDTGTRPFTVTFFTDERARTQQRRQLTPWELRDLILTTSADQKAKLPWLKLATFGDVPSDADCLRYNANVSSISGIELDYDGGAISFDTAVSIIRKARLRALLYTSSSHREDKPRWRILCPTSCELPPERRKKLVARVFGLYGDIFGHESLTLSQAFHYGKLDGNSAHRCEYYDGDFINQCDNLDEGACNKDGKPCTDNEHTAGSKPQADPGLVAACVAKIPNKKLDWIYWNNTIGMGTWRATGGSEAGKKIFREFTDRLKTKYKPKDTPEARWAHYSKSPPNQIGFGTLHRLADEASPGWRAAYEEAANKAARPKFVTFTPAMWHDKPVPVRKWCIDGLIPDVNVTALYGDGGIGKTLLAMQLQIAKAIAGFQWLGIQTEPVKSLGVYCEDDADELHRRVTDIAAHYCCTLDRLTNIELTSRVGEENILVHFGKNDIGAPTPFYDELITHALDIAARLVVLDSLHDVFGGDEISRTHARQFVGFLRRLALKIDGTVLFCGHPSLSGLSSGIGSSGSTAWNNAVRSRLYLTKPEDKNASDDARVLKTVKANYGPLGEIGLTWQRGVFVHKTHPGDPYGQASQAFLDCLDKVVSEGRFVSPTYQSPTYAPRVFSRMPQARGLTKKTSNEPWSNYSARGKSRSETT